MKRKKGQPKDEGLRQSHPKEPELTEASSKKVGQALPTYSARGVSSGTLKGQGTKKQLQPLKKRRESAVKTNIKSSPGQTGVLARNESGNTSLDWRGKRDHETFSCPLWVGVAPKLSLLGKRSAAKKWKKKGAA